MRDKKYLQRCLVLCLGLILISLDGNCGQTNDAAAPSETPPAIELEPASGDSAGGLKDAATIVAEQPIFKFEPVLDGETVTHTFVLKNTGSADLKILKVRTG